jgi:tetratricopeptide (TPR) repeat protein
MKHILFFLASIFLFFSCREKNEAIVNAADYDAYLIVYKTGSTYSLDEDMTFWSERLKRMPKDEPSKRKLAGLHAVKFRSTGRIEELRISDGIYHGLLNTATTGRASLLLGLAQNAITQHQFKAADVYVDSAIAVGERKAAALLVSVDIALELGNHAKARHVLNQFANKKSFAHRIRRVKLKDQQGDLDSAIVIMEAAHDRVKENKDLFCWSLSNLGDMYGHAGRIEDAYHAYISVLQKDPTYDYAIKGIAWVALSHDKNFTEAKRIIAVLAARSRMPEAHLMLAQIAELEGDRTEQQKQLGLFIRLTDTDGYRTMYAKYLAHIYTSELGLPEKGLTIAEQEIKNRPTPQSYDLKAWALLQLGRKKEALSIIQQYVEGETFEPEAAYHMGMVYLLNDNAELAEKHLETAHESSFELGPVLSNRIKKALESL